LLLSGGPGLLSFPVEVSTTNWHEEMVIEKITLIKISVTIEKIFQRIFDLLTITEHLPF